MMTALEQRSRCNELVFHGPLKAIPVTAPVFELRLSPLLPQIAVIANDMAAVNVDASLVRDAAAFRTTEPQVVELTNGCICCSLRTDLIEVQTMNSLNPVVPRLHCQSTKLRMSLGRRSSPVAASGEARGQIWWRYGSICCSCPNSRGFCTFVHLVCKASKDCLSSLEHCRDDSHLHELQSNSCFGRIFFPVH